MQRFLDDYKVCNMKIVSICEKICDSSLITLNLNHLYELSELDISITNSVQRTITRFLDYYQEIIKYLIVVYEGFEFHMGQMAEQWVKYINNFDYLIEEALKIACRKSMSTMLKALSGEAGTGPDPMLNLRLDLIGTKVNIL